MLKFSICGVDNSGVEAVMANPLPSTPDMGSLVGSVVKLGGKIVGKVSRLYRDATGPFVMKASIDDIPALRLSATGCLSAVTVGTDGVELRDFVSDHGQIFAYKSASGDVLQKRFVGPPDALLTEHLAKLPPQIRKSANQEFAEMLVKHTALEAVSHRKPVTSREQRGSGWPNSQPSIVTAREIVPNRNSRF